MDTSKVKANALIETLQSQRNNALNTIAGLQADLAVANAHLAAANDRIEQLLAQVPKDSVVETIKPSAQPVKSQSYTVENP